MEVFRMTDGKAETGDTETGSSPAKPIGKELPVATNSHELGASSPEIG